LNLGKERSDMKLFQALAMALVLFGSFMVAGHAQAQTTTVTQVTPTTKVRVAAVVPPPPRRPPRTPPSVC
jgi:hypothetical protein